MPFALVFDARGTMLRVTIVEKVGSAGYTVLGMANRRLVANPAMASAQQTSRLTRTRGASLMELSADL
jgi:hypothetical protein